MHCIVLYSGRAISTCILFLERSSSGFKHQKPTAITNSVSHPLLTFRLSLYHYPTSLSLHSWITSEQTTYARVYLAGSAFKKTQTKTNTSSPSTGTSLVIQPSMQRSISKRNTVGIYTCWVIRGDTDDRLQGPNQEPIIFIFFIKKNLLLYCKINVFLRKHT